MDTPTPNPGSDESVLLGCNCPRMDNNWGKGFLYSAGDTKPAFWITATCPLHGEGRSEEEASK